MNLWGPVIVITLFHDWVTATVDLIWSRLSRGSANKSCCSSVLLSQTWSLIGPRTPHTPSLIFLDKVGFYHLWSPRNQREWINIIAEGDNIQSRLLPGYINKQIQREKRGEYRANAQCVFYCDDGDDNDDDDGSEGKCLKVRTSPMSMVAAVWFVHIAMREKARIIWSQ